MAWLTPLDSAIAPNLVGATAIYPFENGRYYWQLDLDGRDAVEGIAQSYLHGETGSYFANKAIHDIEIERGKDLGSVALYTYVDTHGIEIASVFISVDADVTAEMIANLN